MIIKLLFAGSLIFFGLGTIGLLSFPDSYTRLHATAVGDTLGFGLCVLAVLFMVPDFVSVLKVLMVFAIVWIINPTISHYVGKVALLRGNWVVQDKK